MKSGIRSGVQAGGSIVINSSVAALLGAPDFTPCMYLLVATSKETDLLMLTSPFIFSIDIASKWGARGVGLAAAVELAPLNIRVNNVHPSLVKTPLLDACWTPEQAKEIESSIGLRRAAEPIEIANGKFHSYLSFCRQTADSSLRVLQSFFFWPPTKAVTWLQLPLACMAVTLFKCVPPSNRHKISSRVAMSSNALSHPPDIPSKSSHTAVARSHMFRRTKSSCLN